jgi:hypothetical protein
MRTAVLLTAAGLLALPVGAHSQSGAADSEQAAANPEVIVQGSKTQKQRVRSFVKTLTPIRGDEQIGRFVDPACPGVVGLSLRESAQITQRFRQVAKAAGVPLADGRCRANVLIIATTSKRVFIESLPRFAPALVYKLPPKRTAALARSPGPVAAWQVPGLLDQNGLPVAGAALDAENPASAVPTLSSNDGSRLNKATQASFMVSVLVVERRALVKMPTRQFADYAAMRTLAPIDPLSYRHALTGNPEAQLPATSILSLFEESRTPADAPPSVTWWDYAFLQALYDMSMTRAAYLQRGEIQARMAKILAKIPVDEL